MTMRRQLYSKIKGEESRLFPFRISVTHTHQS